MKLALAAESIWKTFGGVQALRGVNLSLEEGRVIGLIGPNGSGKSTLLNVLAGTYRPTSGHITLNRVRTDHLPAHRVVDLGVAMTHQIPQPFTEMTAQENVAVAAMFGARKERDPRRAMDTALQTLSLVGLERVASEPAAKLTVQQRKRLEFARVIGTGARLLLLDEIFAGLSTDELREAMSLFAKVQGELGFGALVVEHVMRAVLSLADHIVVLEEGRMIAEGTPKAVVENAAVIEAYLGTEATRAAA